MKTIAIALISLLLLPGCSEIAQFTGRASRETLHIVSEPPGATAVLSENNGVCTTPCSLSVPRYPDIEVDISRNGECDPITMMETPKLNGLYYELQPNPLVVKLNCHNEQSNKSISLSKPIAEQRSSNFTAAQVKEWDNYGIPAEDISVWIDNGFNYPKNASRWADLDLSPPVAKEYFSNGITPEKLVQLKSKGADITDVHETILLESLLDHGYSFKRAKFYAAHDIAPKQVEEFDKSQKEKRLFMKKYNHILKKTCHGKTHSTSRLLMDSPFSNAGECYLLPLTFVSQWINSKAAIVAGYTFYMQFDSPPTSNIIAPSLVLKKGAYQYTSGLGTLRTVPKLQFLDWQP